MIYVCFHIFFTYMVYVSLLHSFLSRGGDTFDVLMY